MSDEQHEPVLSPTDAPEAVSADASAEEPISAPAAKASRAKPARAKPARQKPAPEAVVPAAPEPVAVEEEEEEDDGTPAQLADPFAGGEDAKPVAFSSTEEEQPLGAKQWYILKVQSNREDSIRDTLIRRIRMQGLERHFGEVIVPKEQVTEFKSGKKRVVSRKLYPGYILVNMILNDESWYLVRETGGIGDFTGSAGRPSPRDCDAEHLRKIHSGGYRVLADRERVTFLGSLFCPLTPAAVMDSGRGWVVKVVC